MTHGRLRALLLSLWLWCAGCGSDEPVLILRHWTFEAPSGLAPAAVELPANLERELPAHRSTYWLRTRVELPESFRGRGLTFAFPLFLGRSHLYANGHDVPLLDVEGEGSYRAVGGQRFHIPSEWVPGRTLDLALRVEHTWTRSAWIDTVPRLSATRGGDAFTRRVQIWNQGTAMLAHALLAVLFLFYSLLFLLDRRQVQFGWVALEAFAGAAYPSAFNGTSLYLFGTYEQFTLSLGLPISLWASVHFAHAQFNRARPPRWIDVMLVGVLAVTFAGNGMFSLTRIAGPPIVFSLAVNVLYQMWFTARLWRVQHSARAAALFLSWGALGLFSASEMLSWLGFGEIWGGVQGGCLGIIAIAALQSAVLGGEHIAFVRRSEDLTRELANRVGLLEAQNQEVARLNTELHRQVAARSEQLAQSLTRLAAGALAEPLELSEGMLVDERYRVVRAIGQGGMGRVYEVERVADGMRLALKVLARPDGMAELARFSREAQIAAQLRHPHVVALVDVDVAPAGFLFLVMELVPGLSLREHGARYGDVPWALSILRQIAEGLLAIHDIGVVHRDLKPANVLVVEGSEGSEPYAKITDFGVSSVGGTEVPASAFRDSESGSKSAWRAAQLSDRLRAEAELTASEQDLTRQPARRTHSSLPAPSSSSPPPSIDLNAAAVPSEVAVPLEESLPVAPGPAPAPSAPGKSSPSGSSALSTTLSGTASANKRTKIFGGSSSSGLTQTGMLIGTPRYMAPELADGARYTTQAVDVFSFGVVAYELLARTMPFSEPVAVMRLSQREIPPLRSLGLLCPQLSREVVQLIEQCLNQDPELRPTAEDLVATLTAAGPGATMAPQSQPA